MWCVCAVSAAGSTRLGVQQSTCVPCVCGSAWCICAAAVILLVTELSSGNSRPLFQVEMYLTSLWEPFSLLHCPNPGEP